MELLRNPEVRSLAGLYGLLTLLAAAGGWWISPLCALYVLAVCAAAGILFYRFTTRRYRRLAALSLELDHILHGGGTLCEIPDEEGELAVLQSALYKMTLQLRDQAETLEADKTVLSAALADISHQLRVPLTTLGLLVPRLCSAETGHDSRCRLAGEAGSLLSRIQWLIDALLKLSRLEAGTVGFKQEPVRVSELIASAAAPLEIPMELREQTLCAAVDETLSFAGDFYWSVEAVGNILKNCMEHTPQGGRITVTAQESPMATEILIADNGPGIAPEDRPHLFERFYKGKDSPGDSAGIGLALSQTIFSRQNGSITAESPEGGGALFRIKIYKGWADSRQK